MFFFYLTEYVSVILFLKGVQYDMKKILIVFTVVAMLLMIASCNPGIPKDDVPGVTGPDVEPGETHVNTLSADGESFYAYDIDTSSYKYIECGMTIDVLKPNAGEDTGAVIQLWTDTEGTSDSSKMIILSSTPSSVLINLGGKELPLNYGKDGKVSFDITATVRNDNTMEIELSAESTTDTIKVTTSVPEGSKYLYTGLVAVGDGIPLSYLKLQETSCFRVN